jgi:hypothetical protein
MTVLSKTPLAVAVTGLTGGIAIDSPGVLANPALPVVLPASAVAFGLFLIVFMLDKEVACYDIGQKNKLESLSCNTTAAKPQPQSPSQPIIAALKGRIYEN